MNYIKITHTAWAQESVTIATTIPTDEVELTLGKAISTWRSEGRDYTTDDMLAVLMTEHPSESVKAINFQYLTIYHA